ncbi:MAG: hypothetical protein AB7G13_26995 [Lautropia sp.]
MIARRWLELAVVLAVVAAAASGCAAPARRPIPAGPVIDIAGSCRQTDVDGFREDARLRVRAGKVEELAWEIGVGKRGVCRFDLHEFEQTRTRPHIELLQRNRSGCKLMVYRDPRRITLAHAGCERSCTNGVADEAWPVMFNPKTGSCANLAR